MISVAISSPESIERSNLDYLTPVMGKKVSHSKAHLHHGDWFALSSPERA
jgi:hypothetical protein